ncbi:MAG: hypothetical protein GTO12_22085 [Proteobacteria bacterium]|nr:hypothetical protein [Pseudomonadota bacterium]
MTEGLRSRPSGRHAKENGEAQSMPFTPTSKRRFSRSGFLVCAFLFLFSQAGQGKEPFSQISERYHYRTISAKDGSIFVQTRVEITRREGRVFLFEEHRTREGKATVFQIEIDPKSILPISWQREHRENDKAVKTEIKILEDGIEARIDRGAGKTRVEKVEKPHGPFTVPPLMKFYVGGAMEHGRLDHRLTMVVISEDSFQIRKIEVKNMGVEEITVPAGTFLCRRLKVTPTSSLVGLFVPPGDVYLSLDGTHPLVLGTGRMSRFSSTMKTQLIFYESR